jgi:hypothetical protein
MPTIPTSLSDIGDNKCNKTHQQKREYNTTYEQPFPNAERYEEAPILLLTLGENFIGPVIGG